MQRQRRGEDKDPLTPQKKEEKKRKKKRKGIGREINQLKKGNWGRKNKSAIRKGRRAGVCRRSNILKAKSTRGDNALYNAHAEGREREKNKI